MMLNRVTLVPPRGLVWAVFVVLLLLPWAAVADSASPLFEVRTFVDEGNLGWSYKKPDQVVAVKIDSCWMRWHLAESQHGTWYLVVRDECELSFREQLPMVRAILEEISKIRPLAQFEGLGWPGFGSDPEWQIPIAVASARSAEYQKFRRTDPRERRTSPNAIYIDLAKQIDAYRDWQELFEAFDAVIELTSVEKVFAGKAGELPFHATLAAAGVEGSERVIYEAGIVDFKLGVCCE